MNAGDRRDVTLGVVHVVDVPGRDTGREGRREGKERGKGERERKEGRERGKERREGEKLERDADGGGGRDG